MMVGSSLISWLVSFLLEQILTDELKQNIVDKAREAAADTETKFDDVAVDVLAKLLGVN